MTSGSICEAELLAKSRRLLYFSGVPLKNRHMAIPGHFDWYQPQTEWSYESDNFTQTRDAIIAHRKANPRFNLATDPAAVESEMETRYEGKLRSLYGDGASQWLIGIADGPPPSFTQPRPQRQRQGQNVAGGVVNYVRQTVAGIGLWIEFFGSGPVAPEVAGARASACVRCPLNQPATGALAFSEIAAKELTAILGSLKEKKLSTPLDDRLQVCAACLCPLRAKVFAPLNIVVKHLTREAEAKLDPICWILSEKKALQDSLEQSQSGKSAEIQSEGLPKTPS